MNNPHLRGIRIPVNGSGKFETSRDVSDRDEKALGDAHGFGSRLPDPYKQ
jgi:hypothetical protein